MSDPRRVLAGYRGLLQPDPKTTATDDGWNAHIDTVLRVIGALRIDTAPAPEPTPEPEPEAAEPETDDGKPKRRKRRTPTHDRQHEGGEDRGE